MEEKRGPGRPRSVPEGRGGTITITVTPQMRADLAKSAANLGRSLSQTAEAAIERGRILGDLGESGPAVADALQALARAALVIRNTAGDPTSSISARDELRRRWKEISEQAIPHVAEPASAAAAQAAISATRLAAVDAYEEAGAIAPGDANLTTVRKTLQGIASGRTHPRTADWAKAKALIQDTCEPGTPLGDCLTVLLSAAETAERAVAWAERSNERS